MAADCPVLSTKTVECGSRYDTYKGQKLNAELTLYQVPPSNFCGPLPSGKLWDARFTTPDGVFQHPGGWIWQESGVNMWAPDVNLALFEKRKVDQDPENYIYLELGVKVRPGDILVKSMRFEEFGDAHDIYGLVREGFDFYGSAEDSYYGVMQITTRDLFSGAAIVEPSRGYRLLKDYDRKEWRRIHGVVGQPKFKKS